MYLEEYSPSKK